MERSGVPLIVILGNIGSGKTSVTESLSDRFSSIGERLLLLPEPVNEWKECGILRSFYEDMEKYAFPFQMFAFASRSKKFKGIEWKNYDVCVSDSHTLADRHVFAENLHTQGLICTTDMRFYNLFCDNWEKVVPEMIPDLMIYLDVSVETCLERIKKRGRPEEKTIPADYLKGLQDNFKEMINKNPSPHKIAKIDGERSIQAISADIKETIDLFCRSTKRPWWKFW
jgi:deoxyguanosine kinase